MVRATWLSKLVQSFGRPASRQTSRRLNARSRRPAAVLGAELLETRALLAASALNVIVADTSLIKGETSQLTITFNEAVHSFDNADLTIDNGTMSPVNSADGGITWTATLTPTDAFEGSTNKITVDNTGVLDSLNAPGVGTTDSNNYAIDTERPTVVSIVVADTSLIAGETSPVTFTFSEAITGFDNTDLTVTNGTLSAVSTADGGTTWTATLTPLANLIDATNVISLNVSGVSDVAGNAGIGTSDSGNYTVNTVRPTAGIVVADTSLIVGETSLVTITFSEAVTGFSNADLTIANGTLSAVSSADGGITWTATLTPTASITDTTNVITLQNDGVLNAAGNAGLGTTDSNNYAVDTVRPTATIVVADTSLIIGETSLVTITFNEAVTGFDNTDLTIASGTLSAVTSADGGITWTATLTPTASITDATNIITLDNPGVSDAAGNAGVGTTDSNNYAVDTVRPTATVVVADTSLIIGETSLVTITFNEAVTGFDNTDLTIAGGTLSAVTSADGGITWTATLTPTASITDATNIITLDNPGVSDAAGNAGVGTTDSNNYAVDTVRPTATIAVADMSLIIGETSLVTITFNEAVTGFSNADLTVASGTLSAVSSADGGITWTATLTPTASITDATNVLTLDNTGVSDTAGNAGVSTTDSNNYAVDTQRPTALISLSDTSLLAGETSLVTIAFSEAVTGFDNTDLTIASGTLSAVSTADGGTTWTATLTPTAELIDATNVISLNVTGVSDVAGNVGVGTSNSSNYTVNTVRPTAGIVVADTSLIVGETSLVTITFSEAVTGFSNADLTIANGTLSAVSSADGGITWTATLTPTASITDTTNVITLQNDGVLNAAGNAGLGTTDSNNYAVDTVRPTATIVVADTSLIIGETSLVTITFNEAVTGFDNTDLTIASGTLSAVTSADGGITWTATLTPTASITDATNIITLDNPGVSDAAGNAGVGTTDSNNYAVDTVRPTATVVVADTSLIIGETSLVTITFNEAVTGFDNTDLTIAGGTLSAVTSADGGITWTATLTPTASITDATNIITLDNPGVSDAAGNAGVGTTDSNNYAVDTVRPTATIAVADMSLIIGETSLVTITFNEAVTGFSNADLTVASGTLSAVSSADGGITWTATLTPTASITDATNILTLDNTGVSDTAGNPGVGTTTSNNYAIDTVRPTAVVSLSDTSLIAGETSLVIFAFSEAVTGFDNTDLTVTNGTLSAVSTADGGTTWTATLTPLANLIDATNVISLNVSGVSDVAGNAGIGTSDSGNYTVNTVRPTAGIVVADTSLIVGETSLVTITFSEAVTGFSNADLTIANGTLSAVSSADGGITWTATLTPTASITDTTNVITLQNDGVLNAAGNAGLGTTDSNNYAVDTVRPTATIVVADTSLIIGETSLVTITFNEAVTGFDNTDLTIAGGTLSAVTSADGGITWTATLTPTASITDATNIITLDNPGVSDAAGNAGVGTTDSNNYAVDTVRPTATVVVADTSLIIGETSLVTITFSEAVAGFSNADLTIANGTLTAVSSADGGTTWTATFTPTASVVDATNVITVDNTGVLDAVGNAGVSTTDSNNYAINTVRPTASILVSDISLITGETSLVTITFSEAVTGFNNADLAVTNGTLTSVSSTDGGVTWTATLTPATGVISANNVIALTGAGVFNLAGNSGVGTVNSNNYAVDTKAHTPSVTNAATFVNTQSTSGLVVSRNADSGTADTHFRITAITGGALFQNDGTTAIANGSFITFAQANAGLKFTPTLNSLTTGHFTIQASVSNDSTGLRGSTVVADIVVALSKPTITAPVSSTVSQRPTITWSAVAGAASYEVWINNLSTGGNPFLTASVNSASYVPTVDLGIGEFRVWVRAKSGEVFSVWSVNSDFVVKTPVTLNSINAVQTTFRPTLTWDALPGAHHYDVWINNLSTGTSEIVRDINVTTTSLTVASDLPVGKYRAWVRGIAANDYAASWSSSVDFNVSVAPTVTQGQNAEFDRVPVLAWNTLPGADHYDIWIDNISTGQSQIIRNINVTSTTFTGPNTLPIGNYRAWVRGIAADGYSAAWTTAINFKIWGAPTVTQAQNSTFDRTPTFAWNALPGAAKYQVFIRNLTTGTTTIDQSGIAGVQFEPSSNLADGPYRWWVRGETTQGFRSKWSAPFDIYIGGRTQLLAPAGTTSDTTPAFTWEAVAGVARYDLWVDKVGGQTQIIRQQSLTTNTYTPTTALAAGTYRAWVRAVSTSNESSLWSVVVEFTVAETTDAIDELHALPAAIVQTRFIRTELNDDQIAGDSDRLVEHESQQALRLSGQDATVFETTPAAVTAHMPGDLLPGSVVKARSGNATEVEDSAIDDALLWWTLNQNGVI
jgi:hypothetical protein